MPLKCRFNVIIMTLNRLGVTTLRFNRINYVILAMAIGTQGCSKLNELPMGAGYAAKSICSDYFLSGLALDTVENRLVAPQVKPLNRIWEVRVDEQNKSVTVRDRVFGDRNAHQAHYREGFGCTLVHDSDGDQLDQQPPPLHSFSIPADASWPQGSAGASAKVDGIDYKKLQLAIDGAFLESEAKDINTLAVTVVHNNRLVAEQYALGATPQSRLIGWSMTKSFTSTLVGLLADEGKLDPKAPAPVPEWLNTEKATITLENLLHMAAGLEWSETSKGATPDQGTMLFQSPDYAAYYLAKPQVSAPGTVFDYSTGASSLIARIIQDQLGGTMSDTYQFMQNKLFHKIAITSAVLEYDTVGQPSGGANLYMTARDWSRLGLLYLRQGDWFGERVISKRWLDYALTPSPANPKYGAQIWLNTDNKKWPELPESTYAFVGFEGQYVVMVPEHNLVVTRLGATFVENAFPLQQLVNGVIASLP